MRIFKLTQREGVYTIGYWKNHLDDWPTDTVEIGGVTYSQKDAVKILKKANSKDATYMLTAQLIAAKLNILVGAVTPQTVLDAVTEADAFLVGNPLGSDPRGTDRDYALFLKDILDDYNNGY